MTLYRNYGFNLGTMFNTAAAKDLIFTFLPANSFELLTGKVVYSALPTNLLDPQYNQADFNEDGIVDNDDLTIWEMNYDISGASKAQGDFNQDGFVDGKDLLGWQLNVGATGPLLAASAVPEPASLMLLVAGVLGFAGRRRRR